MSLKYRVIDARTKEERMRLVSLKPEMISGDTFIFPSDAYLLMEGCMDVLLPSTVKNLVLGDSILIIQNMALRNLCFKKVYLGKNVKEIGSRVFTYKNVDQIILDQQNPYFRLSEDGNCLMDQNGEIVWFGKQKEVSGDIRILPFGFLSHRSIHTLVIHEGVKAANVSAFSGFSCYEMDLPSTIQIDSHAFSSIEEVHIIRFASKPRRLPILAGYDYKGIFISRDMLPKEADDFRRRKSLVLGFIYDVYDHDYPTEIKSAYIQSFNEDVKEYHSTYLSYKKDEKKARGYFKEFIEEFLKRYLHFITKDGSLNSNSKDYLLAQTGDDVELKSALLCASIQGEESFDLGLPEDDGIEENSLKETDPFQGVFSYREDSKSVTLLNLEYWKSKEFTICLPNTYHGKEVRVPTYTDTDYSTDAHFTKVISAIKNIKGPVFPGATIDDLLLADGSEKIISVPLGMHVLHLKIGATLKSFRTLAKYPFIIDNIEISPKNQNFALVDHALIQKNERYLVFAQTAKVVDYGCEVIQPNSCLFSGPELLIGPSVRMIQENGIHVLNQDLKRIVIGDNVATIEKNGIFFDLPEEGDNDYPSLHIHLKIGKSLALFDASSIMSCPQLHFESFEVDENNPVFKTTYDGRKLIRRDDWSVVLKAD